MTSNSASSNYFGGGINSYAGTMTLSNSIIAGNAAPYIPNLGGSFSGGNNLTNGTPLLAPLGNYGGPTPTMPPLPGSPAIDGCTSGASFATDQGGFPRIVGPFADIGAVEYETSPVVTTNLDGGVGSLRYAINYTTNGSTIIFASNLSGATVTLTSGTLSLNKNLTIDASGLANGLAINGNQNGSVLNVASGNTVVLNSLVITNGNGGGINNYGPLTVNKSTLVGNSGQFGGGIYNNLMLTVNQSTITGNSAAFGGGICNEFTAVVNQSTITGNSASSYWAGIFLDGGTVALSNSIVAGNIGSVDIGGNGPFTTTGANLTSGNPLLAPLGNYGGPTPTMPPLPGSPALDGCTSGTGFATDQRGFPRVVGAYADIGAVEANFHPVVMTSADSGAGSLRQTILNSIPGSTLAFATNLSGATTSLASGELVINQNLTIDGSALTSGMSINGNAGSRIFEVDSGNVVLNSLIITNGKTTAGGGLYIIGGILTLNQCTLAGNSSSGNGGGIAYGGGATVALNQCTLSANSAANFGGGIYHNGGAITLSNSTVAGNNESSGNDIYGAATYSGVNLTNGTPHLALLGNYGGPTQTMPPLPGSPAIDGCTKGTSFTNDQRGFPRIVGPLADIGAVEGVFNPAGPGTLTGLTHVGNGSLQFGFTNSTDMSFTVLASTNAALPLSLWSNFGAAVEAPAGSGQYHFTDPQATNSPQRFYRVSSP